MLFYLHSAGWRLLLKGEVQTYGIHFSAHLQNSHAPSLWSRANTSNKSFDLSCHNILNAIISFFLSWRHQQEGKMRSQDRTRPFCVELLQWSQRTIVNEWLSGYSRSYLRLGEFLQYYLNLTEFWTNLKNSVNKTVKSVFTFTCRIYRA